MLSVQAQEMIDQLTECQRRIVNYLVLGFMSGFFIGLSAAWMLMRVK